MDINTEVSEFLTSRRERLTPRQVGLIGGGRRRVPGLRREEVAMLAGVSTDYYVRMERGNLAGVSQEILNALATALRLDEAEIEHLLDLARTSSPAPTRGKRSIATTKFRPSLQRMLDAINDAPAIISNPRQDLVASNALGRGLFTPLTADPSTQGNAARFIFLSPASRVFYPDWETAADSTMAVMRTAAGQNPQDKDLTDLIGELVTRSDYFRQQWAAHDVRFHQTGGKHIVHPDVGDLDFVFERLDLPQTPGWTMFVYTAEPGSATAERLRILGSLAATPASTAAEID